MRKLMYGFFSAEAFDAYGGSMYLTPSEEKVLVTCVSETEESPWYCWEDKQFVGPVTEFVEAVNRAPFRDPLWAFRQTDRWIEDQIKRKNERMGSLGFKLVNVKHVELDRPALQYNAETVNMLNQVIRYLEICKNMAEINWVGQTDAERNDNMQRSIAYDEVIDTIQFMLENPQYYLDPNHVD